MSPAIRAAVVASTSLLLSACTRESHDTTNQPQSATVTSFVTTTVQRAISDWSADGKWITWNRDGDIWIKRVVGGEEIQVTEDPADDRLPRWSPDGSRILFVSDRSGVENLWTISPFEGEQTSAPVTTASDSVLLVGLVSDWSGDGNEIVFSSGAGGRWDLRIIPASGGTSRILPGPFEKSWDPSWSPDSEWIAFSSIDEGSSGGADLWIASASGDSIRQLTSESLGDYNAHWAPDGKWIVFTSFGRSDKWDLWMMPYVPIYGETSPHPSLV